MSEVSKIVAVMAWSLGFTMSYERLVYDATHIDWGRVLQAWTLIVAIQVVCVGKKWL
jgi:hypothetical protein